MIRKLYILLLTLLCVLPLAAQTDGGARKRDFRDPFMHPSDTLLREEATQPLQTDSAGKVTLAVPYDATLPALCDLPGGYGLPGAYGLGGLSPWTAGGDGLWRLHEGFNAQFGLSLTTGFGSHAPRGVGFGQAAAFAYLKPLTKRFTLAAGIYGQNMDWGAWRTTDVGVGAMAIYQPSDRVTLYGYASKSFVPRSTDFTLRREPFLPYYLDRPKDRIGAAAEFKLGEHAMIGVSVERRSY